MEQKKQWFPLSYGRVRILDKECINAYEKECEYLRSIDSDRLLCGFRETAGMPSEAMRYPGWESTEIQGHTLGHYLSAISQAYAYDSDSEWKGRIRYLCEELFKCQGADGYLFASPSDIFDRVEKKQPAWVPWYTMHKLFEGLLLAYELAGNETALTVAKRLGDWVFARSMGWDVDTRAQVLSVEYGGMNDCLYDLYRITGEERYAEAAHQFDEETLFDPLRKQIDVLDGLHANTTIPKLLGAVNRYITLDGEEDYLKTAENFWSIVVAHHTYVTGGNSEWEHFGKQDELDMERTACNCETCNTYNMLKLSDRLFQLTGDKKYADFYERTWINAIFSSQNPKTGMTTYFQPMATGYFKVYSTPFDKFWCCTGTGMENFTKQCEGIYYENGNDLCIARFLDSEVEWKHQSVIFHVEAGFPETDTVRIKVEGTPREGTRLFVRIPQWLEGAEEISVTSETGLPEVLSIENSSGWLIFSDLKNGTQIQITYAMKFACHTLQDNPHAVAFTYGPVVLSAELGKEQMETTSTGVDVTVPKKNISIKDYLVTKEPPEIWMNEIGRHYEKDPGKTVFHLTGLEEGGSLQFTPHYRQYQQRYGIYFHLYQKDSRELEHALQIQEEKQKLQEETFDIIPIGNDQYELAHVVKGEFTEVATVFGHRCREIRKHGWVSYRMKCPTKASTLFVVCQKESVPVLRIDGQMVSGSKRILPEKETGFFLMAYPLPENGLDTLEVRFENDGRQESCKIFDEIYIKIRWEEV